MSTVAIANSTPVALSLQQVLEDKLNLIAVNLSNVTTSGFQRMMMNIDTVQQKSIDGQRISYATVGPVQMDTSNGSLKQTNNPLDVGIQGNGYFMVQTSGGQRFTRNGQFARDNSGRLVTASGHLVLSNGGSEIAIPSEATEIMITPNGDVSDGQKVIGKLGLFHFSNNSALKPLGGGLYETSQAPEPAAEAQVLQGFYEESNVQAIAESMDMMKTMRLYEQAQKVIDTEEERQRKVINISFKNSM